MFRIAWARAISSAIAIGTLGVSSAANAYPIFFKCDARGALSDILTASEIQEAVNASANTEEAQRKLLENCRGNVECFAALKQALLLTQQTVAAADKLYLQEVAKLREEAAELNRRIDSSLSDFAKGLYAMANEVYACRKAQEDVITYFATGGERYAYGTFIQHRMNNEYLYVSGVSRKGENRKPAYEQLQAIVESAVAADLDPYTALAVAYLELPGPGRVVPDPSTAVKSLGCGLAPGQKVDHQDTEAVNALKAQYRAQGTPFIYNFGQFFTLTSTAGASPRLASAMRARPEGGDSNLQNASEPSLLCFQEDIAYIATERTAQPVWSSTQNAFAYSPSQSCCTKIPYASKEALYIMGHLQLKDVISRKGPSPEAILQRFNGVTPLMGINEKAGVGAFRLGLNLATDPQYGQQGLDFMLNSFMSNGTIRGLVEETQKKYGKKPASLLCAGRKPGAFAIDSNHYLEKEKKAVRFKSLIGKPWDTFTEEQRRLLQHEWKLMLDPNSIDKAKYSDFDRKFYRSKLTTFTQLSDDAARWEYYQKELYPNYRSTLEKTSDYSWRPITDANVLKLRELILNSSY